MADGGALIVLADGMGGHRGGALASTLAVQTFVDAFGASADAALADRLTHALHRANERLREEVEKRPDYVGMGCTLVGLVVSGDRATWVSVGDSPLWLTPADGAARRLNADHSMGGLVDELARLGKMDPERARTDPRRHMLRSAVTGEAIELVDSRSEPLPPGGLLVLASDGLDVLDPSLIGVLAHETGPERAAEALVQAADREGGAGQDNTTVVVVAGA